MYTRILLVSLLTSSLNFAQQPPSRERGRFSLSGDTASVMAIDPQVKYALIAFSAGNVCVFPADQRIVSLYAYKIHTKAITAALFMPDSKSFLTTSMDGTLKQWDVMAARQHHKELEESNGKATPAIPKPTLTISPHAGNAVTCLAIRPDGKQWATGGSDGTVKLWAPEGGRMIVMMPGAHTGGVKAVEYSPDGKLVASAGADKTVKLWDPTTTDEKPQPVRKLEGHEGPVNAVAFNPDGKLLGAGTGEAKKSGSVHVWDVNTGKREYKLEGHEDVVTCLVFHPKTDHLASGGADKKIRVWDLKDKETKYIDEHAEPLRNFVISPDGTRFGSCSSRAVRWWAGFGK
jgi:WD40 repeat protein